jgi:hypothetical protein
LKLQSSQAPPRSAPPLEVIQWLVDQKIEIRGHAQFPRDIDWHSRSRHSHLEEAELFAIFPDATGNGFLGEWRNTPSVECENE